VHGARLAASGGTAMAIASTRLTDDGLLSFVSGVAREANAVHRIGEIQRLGAEDRLVSANT